jgi:hypothetical protein
MASLIRPNGPTEEVTPVNGKKFTVEEVQLNNLDNERDQKNSPIRGAALEAPGRFETPSPSRISRNRL